MSKILVSGFVNIETTVPVHKFPIEFTPIHYKFHGLNQGIAGSGFTIAKALTCLGEDTTLLSFVGNDLQGKIVLESLISHNIRIDYILPSLKETPQSVMLHDNAGFRQIYFDLKEMQDITYDERIYENLLKDVSYVALCNMNFTKPMLLKAKEHEKQIASFVRAIGDWSDSYNALFMEHADILFISAENIEGSVKSFLKKITKLYNNKIIVLCLGVKGTLLYVREDSNVKNYKMNYSKKIHNTLGVNETLFAAFLYFYSKELNPYEAMENALLYASYKIGSNRATDGFLSKEEFLILKKENM